MVFSQTGKVGINTTTPLAGLHVQDSSVLFRGPHPLPGTPGPPPVSGAGTRMMWYPDKAAFRVGNINSQQWHKDSIGVYSLASGYATKAKGEASIAMGYLSVATGSNAVAIGRLNNASGTYSTAFGNQTRASGFWATSMGFDTRAAGSASTAMGFLTSARGLASAATGYYTRSNGYASLVTGMYNDSLVSPQISVLPTTPLFIIGNGNDENSRSNALIVRKDGRVGIGTNAPVARLHVQDSSVLFSGPATLPDIAGPPPVSGPGTRMMWYPEKAAFRAGRVDGTQWDQDSIGRYSAAFGRDGKAKGENSFVAGTTNTATGTASFAAGGSLYARSGVEAVFGSFNTDYTAISPTFIHPTDRLFVIGNGTSPLNRRNAVTILKNGRMGIGTDQPAARLHVRDSNVVFTGNSDTLFFLPFPPVSGKGARMMWYPARAAFRVGYAFASEWDRDSIGLLSVAMGAGALARGYGSVALGYDVKASSSHSTVAGGAFNEAMGSYSFTGGGLGLQARSFGESVLGMYNTEYTGSLVDMNPTDRLFVIGNGTGPFNRSNAMTVLKNGNVGIGVDSATHRLHVRQDGNSGAIANTNAVAVFERNADAFINILTPSANASGVIFGRPGSDSHGGIHYNPSNVTDGLAFRTGGNNTRMVISSGGNVGIGHTTPQRTLHVSNGSSGASSNSAAVAVFERSGSAVINLLTPNANFSGILFGNVAHDGHGSIVYNNATVNNGLAFQTNGGITRMVVTSAGNVGINTTSPQAKLDIEGNVKLGTTGSVLAHVIKTTVNVNLPSIPGLASVTQTFTVTNAEINSSVLISPATALADGLIISYARVSAANTVEAKFMNATSAAINPPAMDFFITVIK